MARQAPVREFWHPPQQQVPISAVTGDSWTTSPNYGRSQSQKTPERDCDRADIVELQPELMRVEADRDAEVVELDGRATGDVSGSKWI